MTIVLAEKPSVGKEIARVLGCRQKGEGCLTGGKYIVTWALGHLVTLADPEAYDMKYKSWRTEDLPMLPEKMKLVVIKESSKQFRAVKALMDRRDVTEMVIATDAGREGELVARWIMEKAGWKGKTSRLWISSQTDKAIKQGFENLRPASQYDNLFKSARARSEADWLVGLNVTRALTCKFNAQLSAGRVQTPTLALIVNREDEIKSFVPKDYWTVKIKTGGGGGGGGINASWRDSSGSGRIFDLSKAEKLVSSLNGKTCTVTSVIKKKKTKQPPAAYDLTELQRDANKKYAYSAKETLGIMQRLYEYHKVLTYPRTDSRYIPDDVVSTLGDRLRAVATGPYRDAAREVIRRKPVTKFIVNNAKVTDHHAIIPTEEPPDFFSMSGEEQNIYGLVVRRFLAVLSPPAEYEEVKITFAAGKESFYASGRTMLNPGWMSLGDQTDDSDDEADEDEDSSSSLPPVNQGEKYKITEAKTFAKKTAPPARYTEATLLTAMEHPSGQVDSRELKKVLQETSGLGTPATRADIIEKLFSTFYIERRGKELVPTSKGIQLVGLVPEDLRSAELTARWEQRLTLISRGEARDRDFVGDMRKYAAAIVSAVKNSEATYVHDNMTKSKCPDCGKYLLEVNGKKGKMLVCPDRDCGYRKPVSVTTNARCPNCHKKLELRGEGDKKMFVCVCGHRERLSDFEKRRSVAGASKSDVQRYLNNQKEESVQSALAEQLSKWLDADK